MPVSNVALGAAEGLLDSSLTFGRAKSIVARAIGNETDPRILAHAADAIQEAVGEWNRRHQFEWNAIRDHEITVVADVQDYDLPIDFLHAYTVRMSGNNQRPLSYIRQRSFDRSYWDHNQSTYATHYTLFGSGKTGKIQLLPIPDADDTATLKYYSGVMLPQNEGDTFGLPERFVWGIIYKAKALLLLDKDAENERMKMWMLEAEKAFRDARSDDVYHNDEDLRLVSAQEHGRRGFPQTHAYFFYPWGE